MPTTTNYGWTTPADTDLVKDGASAIRTLGTAIDTTVFNNAGAAIAKTIVDAKGDLIVATAADTVARLAVGGTNGHVLQVDSSTASGLKWDAVSGGLTLISETVANANSSISLSSIPGTYKQLILAWQGITHSATGSDFGLRFNNDSTATAYETQGLRVRGTTIDLAANQFSSLAADFSETNTIYAFGSNTTLSFARTSSTGYLIIDNYASTTKYKQVNVNFNYFNSSASVYVSARNWSMWASTSAITSLDIVRLSGSATISNTTNTSIRLYGVS